MFFGVFVAIVVIVSKPSEETEKDPKTEVSQIVMKEGHPRIGDDIDTKKPTSEKCNNDKIVVTDTYTLQTPIHTAKATIDKKQSEFYFVEDPLKAKSWLHRFCPKKSRAWRA